jgi:hypothetical protein
VPFVYPMVAAFGLVCEVIHDETSQINAASRVLDFVNTFKASNRLQL